MRSGHRSRRAEFRHTEGHDFDFADVGTANPRPLLDATAAPTIAPDDRRCGWSSTHFLVKPQPLVWRSTNACASDRRAVDLQEPDARSASPLTATQQADGLFVPMAPR